MRMLLNAAFRFLSSLRLTVFCLFLSVVLVFLGTLAQVEYGLYNAQNLFFRSFFIFWEPKGADWKLPVFPGGYLLGGVLLANLVAAHISRFALSRKKLGIFMVHAGLILLLLGQLLTDLLSVESNMRLVEGQARNYSEDSMHHELAILDVSHSEYDEVVSIPETLLKPGKELSVSGLPLKVRVRKYHKNSTLHTTSEPSSEITHGLGRFVEVHPQPPVTVMDRKDVPSAVIEIGTEKESLGTWLVSTQLEEAQSFTHEGKAYQLEMRPIRHYKPYSIQLLDFTHEIYKGTDIPKNFSSRVRLVNSQTQENRETLIFMNNPLRYGGETYYQGSFDPNDERVSILLVVKNPGWLTPYFSCSLVALGLVTQFMSHLIPFLKKRRVA